MVTGIIKDENGEPVIGVNVIEKGTTNGIVTDLDGHFLIQVPEKFADQPKTPDDKGYIKRFPDQTTLDKGWLDKYYLLPLPLNEVAHNPALLPNNPVWETPDP